MSEQHLEVDWTRCDGHGLCAHLLPDRIVMDEWGFPVVRRGAVASSELADTKRAISLCPALALRLSTR